jgi:lipopolysaccharide export system permease protein
LKLTLFKYISQEIWSVFFVSLLVFVFIALGANMMSMMNMLVNQGISVPQLSRIILCMLPQIILFSLPAAGLMSVMLAFIRLAGDNEIIAMNASGISLYQMLPPVVFFSLVCCLLAGFLTIFGVPWGNRSYGDYYLGIIRSNSNITIKERNFYEPIDKVVFYINSFSLREKKMKNLFVVDRRDDQVTNTIIAESGIITTGGKSNTITIRFFDGTVFIDEKGFKNSTTIVFKDTFDMNIDLGDIASRIALREKKPNEMYIGELISNLRSQSVKPGKKNEMAIILYEMFSIPLAILILGIIGASLGSHVKAHGRSIGVIISLLVFLIYYMSLMGSRYLCAMKIVAPLIGVCAPVLLLVAISTFLLSTVKKLGYFSFFH